MGKGIFTNSVDSIFFFLSSGKITGYQSLFQALYGGLGITPIRKLSAFGV